MSSQTMTSIQQLFLSRLGTLEHIMGKASQHFSADGDTVLTYRLIQDMLPLSTQIAFTCNQPHNFVLWCQGHEMDNLEPEIPTITAAQELIASTKNSLADVELSDAKLAEHKRLDFGNGNYVEFTGSAYVNDFLIPNFYFHLVTAYDILRMQGVPLGKPDYMVHLMPLVKSS